MNELDCDVQKIHQLFGRKWTLGLIHNIGERRVSFNELSNLARKEINPTLLSNRLKELERFKLVRREESNGRVFYSISENGKRFKTILLEIRSFVSSIEGSIPDICQNTDCSNCRNYRKRDLTPRELEAYQHEA